MNLAHKYEDILTALIIQNSDIYFENADIIHEKLFVKNKDIFKAFMALVDEGRHINIDTIIKKLPKQEQQIYEVSMRIDYETPIDELIFELNERHKNESILKAVSDVISAFTSDERIEILSNVLSDVIDVRERKGFVDSFELARQMFKSFDAKHETGIKIGFDYFDELTGGLQPTDLVIIAAESSMGKTSFGLQMCNNILGMPQCFISLEMSNLQLIQRLISQKSSIALKAMKYNIEKLQMVASGYQNQHLYVAENISTSISTIIGYIRSAKIKHGIKVAFIDYLQLITDGSARSREQEVGQIARKLKNLAKELDITIVAFSQLSRPKDGKTHFPTLARLRDSGQIEEAADIVKFLYRPEYYGLTEWEGESTNELCINIIAKGRNYGTGTFKTRFYGKTTQFSDWDNGVGDGGGGNLQKTDSLAF